MSLNSFPGVLVIAVPLPTVHQRVWAWRQAQAGGTASRLGHGMASTWHRAVVCGEASRPRVKTWDTFAMAILT